MTNFVATEIVHPVLAEDKESKEAQHTRASQYYLLEEKFYNHNVSWMKRTPWGVLAVFEKGNPLPAILEIQKEFEKFIWDKFGKAGLKTAVHLAESDFLVDDYRGPGIEHVIALLKAAQPGQILLTQEAIDQIHAPVGYFLRDLGVHALRDLSEPGKIFSLRPKNSNLLEEPPVLSLQAYPQNLPPQATPFYGREDEITTISEVILRPTTRLITLVGPGGFGKTRLSLKVASQVVDRFQNGVFFIELAPLSSERLLVESLAHALKFVFTGTEDSQRQLMEYLSTKEMLILMDNFEHVLEGAELVRDILTAAPRIKVLATSREKLQLEWEQAIEVRGLPCPAEQETENLEKYSAVQLFIRNGRSVLPSFAPSNPEKKQIARICRTMEGMPLGIELSSAWVKKMSIQEIEDKINANRGLVASEMPFLPARHQSLRAVFEYSWALLNDAQKKALRAASVFKGGFTPEAASQVGGVPPSVWPQLEAKSLVRQRANGTYELHDLLKYFAKEKLFDDPPEKERIQDAHSAFLADLLRKKEKELYGPNEGKVMESLIGEMGNIREGWRRSVEKRMESQIEDFLDSLFTIYDTKGWYQEGMEVFQHAARVLREKIREVRKPPKSSMILLGKLLSRWAALLQRMGDVKEAKKIFEESLGLLKSVDAWKQMGFSLSGMAIVLEALGRDDEAKSYYRQSFDIYRKVKDRNGMAWALNNLGHIAIHGGDFENAKIFIQEAMKHYEAIGYLGGAANSYNLMGDVLHEMGEYEQARRYSQKGLSAFVGSNDRKGVAWSFTNLGKNIMDLGDFNGAKQMFQEGLNLHKEFGDKRAIGWSTNFLAELDWAVGDYAGGWEYAKKSLHYYRLVGDPKGQARALSTMGNLAVCEHRYEEARQNYEEANNIQIKEGAQSVNASWHFYHLAAVDYAEGKTEDARVKLEKALKNFRATNGYMGTVITLTLLSEVYCEMGQPEKSKVLLKEAIEKALKSKAIPHLVDLLVALAKYLKMTGDERNAFAYLAAAVNHPTCRRQTKDKVVRLVSQLESQLSSQEVDETVRWAKASSIEDAARVWLTQQEGLKVKPKAKSKKAATKRKRKKR